MENFSQNDEQDVILTVFNTTKGKFLDIGAYDGKTLSNTHALALLGWEGVCVEPSPKNFENLYNLYKDNRLIHIYKIAIGDMDGIVEFYDTPGDFYGSIIKGNGNRYGKQEELISVPCWTPETLFKQVGYNFRFISLDVEANNFDVLKRIPFSLLTSLQLICIEHDGHSKEMETLLSLYGFTAIHKTPENIILRR